MLSRTCPILAGLLVVAIGGAAVAAEPAAPKVKWIFEAGSPVYSSPMVADLNGDGALEVVIIASATRKVIAVGANGKELWRAGDFRQRLTATPTVAQLDAAGGPEILVPSRDRGLVCFDATGKERWQVDVGGWLPWQVAVVTDAEGDGAAELYVSTDRFVFRIAPDGKIVWRTELPPPGVVDANYLAVGDTNGDGMSEIIAPVGWGGVVCLSAAGAVRWTSQVYAPVSGTPVIADIDADKRAEVICGTDDGVLFCLNGANGNVIWSHRTANGITTSIAVADVDADGKREVFFGDAGGYLYLVGADGLERWAWDALTNAESPPAIGDVDGDGAQEILVGIGNGDLLCMSANGDVEWRYPTGKRIVSSPTLCDVDGDGLTEILLTSHDMRLHCLSAGGRFNPSAILWPMIRFDAGQTGWAR